jgi:hypothetical protein
VGRTREHPCRGKGNQCRRIGRPIQVRARFASLPAFLANGAYTKGWRTPAPAPRGFRPLDYCPIHSSFEARPGRYAPCVAVHTDDQDGAGSRSGISLNYGSEPRRAPASSICPFMICVERRSRCCRKPDAQIAPITGHSLKTITVILARYLAPTRGPADQAIFNFENSPRTEFANRLQTVGASTAMRKGKSNE